MLRLALAALIAASATAQAPLPRRTFKFGAIISGDEGLRTTETHGE